MGENKQWSDFRDITYKERIKIGFNNLGDKWQTAPAIFTADTLRICGHPVMEGWEDNYMELLAEIVTLNNGIILEVGFGLGISSSYIQMHEIDKHIIIEANKDVFEKAKKFARKIKHKIKLVFGFWEEAINLIEDNSIDGVLFDTYPLRPEEIHSNHFNFFNEAYRILKKNGVLTYYSDEINNFSKEHIKSLTKAGFKKISGKICQVNPPPNCQYWKSNKILAPIIIK